MKRWTGGHFWGARWGHAKRILTVWGRLRLIETDSKKSAWNTIRL